MGKFLKKILSLLRGKDRSKPQGLPTALIFGGLIAMMSAIFSIKLTLARRKIGKLQHTIDVQKKNEKHAKHLKEVQKNVRMQNEIGRSIQRNREYVREVRQDMALEKQKARELEASLKKAKEWTDIRIK